MAITFTSKTLKAIDSAPTNFVPNFNGIANAGGINVYVNSYAPGTSTAESFSVTAAIAPTILDGDGMYATVQLGSLYSVLDSSGSPIEFTVDISDIGDGTVFTVDVPKFTVMSGFVLVYQFTFFDSTSTELDPETDEIGSINIDIVGIA